MEITRIKEKNIRIGKIVQQLKLSDAIMNPSLDEDETPEKLLVVKDSEVLVEKYISPEEEKKLEEEAKQEEKRRRAEMGDNPRERALDMMMGGRLEANVEEDLFKVSQNQMRIVYRDSIQNLSMQKISSTSVIWGQAFAHYVCSLHCKHIPVLKVRLPYNIS